MTTAPQTRAVCSAQPEGGHETFVTVHNAMLAARDKASAENKLDSFNLRAVFDVLLALGLDQATCLEALHDADPEQKNHDGTINAARSNYCNDECEIDDKPLLSVGDEGVWVSAWVYVDTRWSCDNCGETLQDGSGDCITCGQTDEEAEG